MAHKQRQAWQSNEMAARRKNGENNNSKMKARVKNGEMAMAWRQRKHGAWLA
jgi:hypothetical protein